jgi:hypothetical protein
MKVTQSEGTSAEGMEVIKLSTAKRKNEDDLDDIWGGISCATGGGEKDKDVVGKERRSSGASTSASARPKPAAQGQGHGTGGSDLKLPPKNSGKRAKEIGLTEKVVLEADQALRMLADINTIRGVTMKQMLACEKRLADRLTPALISQYSQNFDATAEAQGGSDDLDKLGMHCLESARDPLGCVNHKPLSQVELSFQPEIANCVL